MKVNVNSNAQTTILKTHNKTNANNVTQPAIPANIHLRNAPVARSTSTCLILNALLNALKEHIHTK